MTPGWARTCTCGATAFGYYCGECNAWAGAMPSDVAPHNDFNLAKHMGPETSAPRGAREGELSSTPSDTGLKGKASPHEDFCPGGHRGATVRGNAAYCAECGGRIRPTASSRYTHGTGH